MEDEPPQGSPKDKEVFEDGGHVVHAREHTVFVERHIQSKRDRGTAQGRGAFTRPKATAPRNANFQPDGSPHTIFDRHLNFILHTNGV